MTIDTLVETVISQDACDACRLESKLRLRLSMAGLHPCFLLRPDDGSGLHEATAITTTMQCHARRLARHTCTHSQESLRTIVVPRSYQCRVHAGSGFAVGSQSVASCMAGMSTLTPGARST